MEFAFYGRFCKVTKRQRNRRRYEKTKEMFEINFLDQVATILVHVSSCFVQFLPTRLSLALFKVLKGLYKN